MAEKVPDKLSQYLDPTGEFTNKDLARSAWFVKNKILLRKIVIVVLLLWIGIAGLYSLIMLGAYLFSGFWNDRQSRLETVQEFQNYTLDASTYAAAPLQIDSIKIFQTGESYDFYSLAINPNLRFVARVKYKYVFEGGETPEKIVTIDPGKKIPLTVFGFQSNAYPATARLQIEETKWRKINSHQIADVKSYMDIRLNFSIDNLQIEHNAAGGPVPPRITFDIQNNSAYSYYEGRFALLLLSSGNVAGIQPLLIKDFRAGQTFPVDVRPAFDIGGIDDIEVVPLMEVFDSNEFLPVQK